MTGSERFRDLRLKLIPPAVEGLLRGWCDKYDDDVWLSNATRHSTLASRIASGMGENEVCALMLNDPSGNDLIAVWTALTVAQRNAERNPAAYSEAKIPRDDVELLRIAMLCCKDSMP